MAEYINKTDTLNEGRVKINNVITDAENAEQNASEALDKANTSIAQSTSTQEQLDNIIIDSGTSDAEVIQARTDEKGVSHATLKNRIDDGFTGVKTQLAETDNKLNVKGWELNSKGRDKKGITVYIIDDGLDADYNYIKPIFESLGIPFCPAVIADRIGTSGYMTLAQLLELQNELGCEIVSHSKTHPQPFPEISDEQAEIEFRESNRILNELGLKVENYAYVGGNYKRRELMLAKKHYRSARSMDYGNYEGINYPPFASHELKSFWVDPSEKFLKTALANYDRTTAIQMMIDKAKEKIDEARDNNGLLIIGTHARYIDAPDLQDMFREIAEYAKQQTEVLTISDALDVMGNIVETGIYSEDEHRVDNETHFVVGVDGITSGSATLTPQDWFSLDTPFNNFPYGIVNTPISFQGANNAQNAPEKYSGLLTTYKMHSKQIYYSYQEYRVYETNRVYRRIFTNQTSYNSFSEWKLISGTYEANRDTITPSTPLSHFSEGLSIANITTNNSGINQTPRGKRGMLLTFVASEIGSHTYSYQEFISIGTPIEVHKRFASSFDSWGDWESSNAFYSTSTNNFHPNTKPNEYPEGSTRSKVLSTSDGISGAPEQKSGQMITEIANSKGQWNYSFQEYHIFNSVDWYKRIAASSTAWGSWVKMNS